MGLFADPVDGTEKNMAFCDIHSLEVPKPLIYQQLTTV